MEDRIIIRTDHLYKHLNRCNLCWVTIFLTFIVVVCIAAGRYTVSFVVVVSFPSFIKSILKSLVVPVI